jgi:mono/diheme cytochrome c family protein
VTVRKAVVRRAASPSPAGRAASLSLLLLLLFPAGSSFGQAPADAAQNATAGARVFGAKGCAGCHAINGIGGGVGPDLAGTAQRKSFYDLASAMWNHLPRMAAVMRERGMLPPRLNARETGDLVAFLFTVDYLEGSGNAEVGKRLFLEKRCIMCHQVAGSGGVVGPNLDYLSRYGSPIMVAAALWNHGPAMSEAMRARGIQRPTFTGSELLDLISYLESAMQGPPGEALYVMPGRPAEGRELFAAKGCLLCHSVGGQGGRVGPDLAGQRIHRGLTAFAAAMWNKAPAMTAAMRARGIEVPRLSAGEMTDLVAYLYSMQYFAESGDARRGGRLIRTKGCVRCHSLNGSGGSTAGDLAQVPGMESLAGVIAALWNHTLVIAEAAEEIEWPSLSPQETADVAAFLGSSRGAR